MKPDLYESTDEAQGRRAGRALLDRPLTHRQAERLRLARERALARAGHGTLALPGGRLVRHGHPSLRWSGLAGLALLLLALTVWWQYDREAQLGDSLDAVLLADELPPDAWLSDQLDGLGQES
ncbi:DUF3619 family protein [Chitinimonas koreensis]|uniref:DUF3619 family protein n=1 Tax=Chitinimonas koreensis TaxID=356302 RepID=UPI00040B3AB5|nr:DUF3619 family protein [Chitinimonas koreensis]QNM96332.1 DUF3619 family protein [Chitinimonas koreensis]